MSGKTNYPAAVTVLPFHGDTTSMATIARLHLQVRYWQREQGQHEFRTNIHDSQADLTRIMDYCITPGGNFFVATVGTTEVAGFVGLRKDGDHQARLKRLAVLPHHQHQGIGSLLVRDAVAWARTAGFQRLHLSTGVKEKGRPIYEKYGFLVTGYDAVHDDWQMELLFASNNL
jgi:GNAT superfamily N-acetyltransferase